MSCQNLPRHPDISTSHFLARLVGLYTLTAADVAVDGDYCGTWG